MYDTFHCPNYRQAVALSYHCHQSLVLVPPHLCLTSSFSKNLDFFFSNKVSKKFDVYNRNRDFRKKNSTYRETYFSLTATLKSFALFPRKKKKSTISHPRKHKKKVRDLYRLKTHVPTFSISAFYETFDNFRYTQ